MVSSKQVPVSEAYWFQEGPGVRTWQFTTSGVKLLNVGNITKDGNIDLDKTDKHISLEEAEGKYSHFLVDEGDLVIASSGISFDEDGMLRTRGAFIEKKHLPLCLNTSTIRFKAIDGVSDLNFFKFWLDSFEFRDQVSRLVTGSAQQNFGPSHLKAINISLPSLTEQKRIASLLACADRLRQLRRTAHDLSASVLQSVFLEMFGDIAKNEKGWNAEKLEDLCDEITVGYVGPMASEYNHGGVVFLRSQNVKPFRIDLNDVKYVSPEFHKKLKKSAIYPGNVIVIRTGLAGTAAVVPDNFPDANCSDLVIIRPSSKINNQYLAMLFNSTWGKGHVSGNAVGQIQQHFNIGSANEMKVPLPPLSLQEEFAGVVARVESLRGRMGESARQVEGLFESLLAQSFDGGR